MQESVGDFQKKIQCNSNKSLKLLYNRQQSGMYKLQIKDSE